MSDKSNAVTDDEFVEADELLASIPVEAEAMDLAEADGFMTAVQLLPKTPETKDWLPHILSTIGAKDAGTGSAASDKRLRALLLKRFHQIGDQLTQAVPLDPVYFEAEDEYGLHYSQMIESYMVPSHGASEDSANSLIPYAYAGYMEVT